MLQDNKLFFINCLNDHLHNRKTTVPENVDINTLISAAKQQELLGIVYHQLKDSLREKDAFFSTYMATLFHYGNLKHQYELVLKKLSELSITAIPVKGLEIAQFYPVPALRTMGDIDLLIRDEDKPQIDAVMKTLGYSCEKNVASRDWGYIKDNFEFEFHPKLIYLDEEVESKEFASFFNDFSAYTKDGKLTDEFHFLFLIAHLRKHILNRGAGFRQFMDIAVMTDKLRDSIDWQWIRDELDELGLERFSDVVFSCNKAWFDIEPPYPIRESSAEDIDMIAERILDGGVFGFHAEDAGSALLGYQISNHGGFIGRVKSFFRIVFPPYSLLRAIKQYEFVNNRPWLVPLAWIYRMGVSIGKLISRQKKIRHTEDNQINHRIEYIRILGLDK